MAWLSENWWMVWGIGGGLGYIAYRVYARGGEESLGVRMLYAFAPVLDPNSSERRQLTPRALVLFGIGLLLGLGIMVYEVLFK